MSNIKTPDLVLDKVEPGSELIVLEEAMARLAPGGFVCYHRGLTGSAPTSMKRAAWTLHERGTCLLTQRYIGHAKSGERLVEYLAIKAKR